MQMGLIVSYLSYADGVRRFLPAFSLTPCNCCACASSRLDGRQYAVKKIKLQTDGSSSSYNRILREVATLSRLQHPNVVRYFQVRGSVLAMKYVFLNNDANVIYLIFSCITRVSFGGGCSAVPEFEMCVL